MTATLALALLTAATTITGTVRDQSGAAVAGATVLVRTPSGAEHQTLTGPDGRFAIPAPEGEAQIVVRAGGFAEKDIPLPRDRRGDEVEVVLSVATRLEAVTVTASRAPSGPDTPGATTVLTSTMLAETAALMLDDQLRSVPGFSLFRRSSSRVANPTTQGVTMRGLSASGASRSVVLVDGVPLNDAFGGWVYWDRIPQTAVDRIEVVHGATGDLYGADAVGGVLQAFTIAPSQAAVRASAELGTHATPRLSMFAGGNHRAWSGFATGEWQRSDGFFIIAPEQRGPVDTPAAAEYGTAYADVGYQTGALRLSARGNFFQESRQNGTELTTNNTASRQFAGDVSGTAGVGVWLVRGYGGTQGYDQSFSSVNATRTIETLTQLQHVPSGNAGGTAQFSLFAGRMSWLFGADARRIHGESDERSFNARGQQTGSTNFGGVESVVGLFARAEATPTDTLTITGSIRGDRWTLDPNTSAPSRDATQLSPKAGVSWRATPTVVVHALATHAFRAPTLNELFRNFRVGNTVTSANADLRPETLTGVEGGAAVTFGSSAELRITGFWNHLDDAVTNLTISSTPVLITRMRANAGTIRAAGADIQTEWQVARAIRASVGLELVDSIYAASQEPGLTGNRVPQVPRVQGSAGVRIEAPASIVATAQVRVISSQYDDDRNQFLLGSATIVDLLAARPMGHGVQLFGAIENLFNDEYDVALTPTRNIGLPRTARIGVRAYLGR